jgi:hypothetical protein
MLPVTVLDWVFQCRVSFNKVRTGEANVRMLGSITSQSIVVVVFGVQRMRCVHR